MASQELCAHHQCSINEEAGKPEIIQDNPISWVQCDAECNQWFHMHCVAYTASDEEFVCSQCQSKMKSITASEESAKMRRRETHACVLAVNGDKFQQHAELALKIARSRCCQGSPIALQTFKYLKGTLHEEHLLSLQELVNTSVSQLKLKSHFWSKMHQLRSSQEFVHLSRKLIFDSTDDLPNVSKTITQAFIQALLEAVEGELYDKNDSAAVDPCRSSLGKCVGNQMVMETALRHMAGAVLRKVLKRVKKEGDTELLQYFKTRTVKRFATKENEYFTEKISRGGLIFVSENWFELFKEMDRLASIYYDDVRCDDRKSLAMAAISSNANVLDRWTELCPGKEAILQLTIATFLTNKGNLLGRIMKEKVSKCKRLSSKPKQKTQRALDGPRHVSNSGLRKCLKPINA